MAASTGVRIGALGIEPTTADQFFVALDQHRIEGASGDCVVEISGIHEAPRGGAWVQAAVAGDPTQTVVLYLAAGATVDDAIAALEVWGRMPLVDRPYSIDVTRSASLAV